LTDTANHFKTTGKLPGGGEGSGDRFDLHHALILKRMIDGSQDRIKFLEVLSPVDMKL
jgi:hypothetical protein